MSAPPPDNVTHPPSLCRRGPASLHIFLKSGKCPKMSRGRIHILAGRTLVIQVAPPNPQVRVEITIDPAIHAEVSANPVGDASVPVYHGEYAGHLPSRVLPWPVTAKLCVVICDGLPNPCRLTIPITVWPSFGLMLTWWVLVFLGLVGLRWKSAFVEHKSIWSIFPQFCDDLPFIGAMFLFGVPVLGGLWLLGWVATLRAP